MRTARSYLETLCGVKPNRRTGSAGNRAATRFLAETIGPHGFEVDTTPFECLDYIRDRTALTHGSEAFEVEASPYSLPCDVLADLATVSTVQDLERVDCRGKILLMRGAICAEPLMPKNFVFYNPEHHQAIVGLLERRKPAGIITATGRNPDQAGALYPFPLIVDGDFDIPSVYCRDSLGDLLAAFEGDAFQLTIEARRVPSRANNVVARLNGGASRKIVLTAHIDAYEDSPGATDDASGVVVLLLCAEMLSDYRGEMGIEIAALNGEDYYSAGGQMDYLRRYGAEFPRVLLAVNIDDVGYHRGRSSYSFYECPPHLETAAEAVLQRCDGLIRGPQWFSGDHMIFVQSGVPAMALTAELADELMQTVVHTSSDTPEIVDCHKLVQVAKALDALVRSL